jgi:hypothetical protein
MQSLVADLIDSIVAMPDAFTDVALHDPLSALLMALGTILFLVTFGVFGYLGLGAVADLFTPETTGRSPPQAGR